MDSDGGGYVWQRERVADEWADALEHARRMLLSNKTRTRVQFLSEQLVPLAQHEDLSLMQTLDIFKLLTLTYPRYVDSASRDGVEAVGVELVRRDEARGDKIGATEQIIGWIVTEAARMAKMPGSHAPANILVLLSWCSGLYTVVIRCNSAFVGSHPYKQLSTAMAVLLDLILNPASHAKPSLQRSALTRVRRALRSAPEHLKMLIVTLLTLSKASLALSAVPLVCTGIEVTVRLKDVKDESLRVVSDDVRQGLLSLYIYSVLMSRTTVSSHTLKALRPILEMLTETEFKDSVLPAMEKSMLRSPEVALDVISDFFLAYRHLLAAEEFRRLLAPTMNASKSANVIVRNAALALFRILVEKKATDDGRLVTINELVALAQGGKAAGPDRQILYSMLGYFRPSLECSSAMVSSVPGILAKETNDAAILILANALTGHLVFHLRNASPLPPDVLNTLVKEMQSSKPVMRRAFVTLVGDALWEVHTPSKNPALALAQAALLAFEASLRIASSSPLNANGGPLEGFVAAGALLGPLSRVKILEETVSHNTVIQGIPSGSVAKPSFLLWDKVYQKLLSAEEETWFLRTLESTTVHMNAELSKNEQFRTQLGLAFLHLAVEGKAVNSRKQTLVALERLTFLFPKIVNQMVHQALVNYALRLKPATKQNSEADKPVVSKHPRVLAFMYAAAAYGDDIEDTERQEMLTRFVVIAHHPEICGSSRQGWIELCQKAKMNPQAVVDNQVDVLFSQITEVINEDNQESNEATYRAITTLAFVSPQTVLPRVVSQLKADLVSDVKSLTDTDFGIWETPEGKMFTDVLASKKATQASTKGKGADLDKWDAEVRKQLLSKQKAQTLSKQDQALVSAQLSKESAARERISRIRERLLRGLRVIRHLVAGGIIEFKKWVRAVAEFLVQGGALYEGSRLVGMEAFETYLDLAKCCSDRLGIFGMWVGVATLRSLSSPSIPENYQAESLNSLVLRVLYRLRTLSEQTPLDAATFSYLYPLIHQVLLKGGVGLTEEDDPLEQAALSLDIIKFHCGDFNDTTFPRTQTIQGLVHALRHQLKLSKEASSVLIELGQTISASATKEEVDILLASMLFQEAHARNASLQALQPFDLTDLEWSPELLVACHDSDEQNARLARHLWDDNGLDVPESYIFTLLTYLEHENVYVRSSVAGAFTEAVERWPQSASATVTAVRELYKEKAKILAPQFDQYGMVVEQSLERTDPWQTRAAVAQSLQQLASAFSTSDTVPFFGFLIKDEALGDRNPDVRRAMLEAGTAVIDAHGSKHLPELISMFEGHLATSHPASETADFIQEAVVILIGRIARHLDASDSRLPSIVTRLVEALKTPSEQVQVAVSDCLAPLVHITRSSVPKLFGLLLDDLFNAHKYATRRGAAYGLAGIIRGIGVTGMKEFDVLNKLKTATEDRKKYEPRQGAMFALETFSSTLSRLFEPYAINALPLLLASFGDSIPDVREAATDAARVIMGNMSGYGVKLILPDLLSGLDEKQWRTKKGSIELLGMMAYCAPRQLSQSLPIIIPRLTGVLTDTHAQVRAAANKSLKQFGEVISNPEIQALVPAFLKAMVDPAKTPNALSALLKTSFVHYIDHSSLALVIPILERGLRERGADTKKKAAQIIGNLASLTDSKDFVPYLSGLLPMVHMVLVDPVPEARATAAKTLGTLVERLGEVNFPDLVPSLIRTLKTDTSGVDRQGAAQGLSEVLSGLGMERLEGLLPDIIINAQSPRSTVREGFMSLLVFLPATFGARFQPHLPKIIVPILKGLSDTEEYVREAAMRAGRMIITNYSGKAIDLLLPALERGMFDPGWRIRQSSITLIGELLFKVTGVSGKNEIEEDEEGADVTVAEISRKALTDVLGAERRDRILSALYMARQDAVHAVRTSSIHIWKALVANTPRTVREILPELVTQVMALLCSLDYEQQETASRTTAELCRKFGERIVGEIVTILRSKATTPDGQTREGVCLVLCEVMSNATDTQWEGSEDGIITMVRTSLVDDQSAVRSAAAKAFDILQEKLGAKAIDQTIPTLLEALRQPGESSGTALQALKEVMTVRASTVFPVLIPTLTAIPMSVFNAHALASLVTVAGNALSKRLTVILTALAKMTESLRKEPDEELQEAITEAIKALMSSVDDAEGLNTLMLILLGWIKHEDPERRITAADYFALFCEVSELDASLYRTDWIRQLIPAMDDRLVAVHTAVWYAFDAFVKSVPKDELEPLVVPLRRSIESTASPHITVPGFGLPKGISPFVPIIIAGLTTGSNEQREQAAYAIGDLVERTEENAIKPFVVPFTGPLIRVATQATTYPPAVKTGILSALTTMLERIPAFVKPFFPQLQRTFVKSASDPASVVVRNKAAVALGVLMKSQPRVDPVVTELVTGARSNDDSIAASLILALSYVIRSAGQNVGGKARETALELVADAFKEQNDEHYSQAIGQLFAVLTVYNDLVRPIIDSYLVAGTPSSAMAAHCTLAVLTAFDEDQSSTRAIPAVIQADLLRIAKKVNENLASDRPNITRPSRQAREILRKIDSGLISTS
ncbi:ARM repeat-containing protein [Vararia minispora EC-137]|uniref:ARM repeat-containing protein n=1 Tax=Vararia minispora EC-137 TaxID=1314806 RepID=A0ACB8QUT3_9AGAM|nr:ARM repeat-containing protein [Vararia minispora EC-137]